MENEIESWYNFGDILRNENRITFCQMLEISRYIQKLLKLREQATMLSIAYVPWFYKAISK